MSEENDIRALAQSVVEYYKSIPEEFKQFVAFRHERANDKDYAELYELFGLMKKLSKMVKNG